MNSRFKLPTVICEYIEFFQIAKKGKEEEEESAKRKMKKKKVKREESPLVLSSLYFFIISKSEREKDAGNRNGKSFEASSMVDDANTTVFLFFL